MTAMARLSFTELICVLIEQKPRQVKAIEKGVLTHAKTFSFAPCGAF
jgi:hypothetical protein